RRPRSASPSTAPHAPPSEPRPGARRTRVRGADYTGDAPSAVRPCAADLRGLPRRRPSEPSPMTTPAPVTSTARARRKAARAAAGPRPRLRMGLNGFLVAWLLPNLLMAALVLGLTLMPSLQGLGSLTPLLTVVGVAGLV